MGIWLSCGHREDEFKNQYSITTKEWEITERGWTKALGYKTVCYFCYKKYRKEKAIFDTDKEAMSWLFSDKI